jgi:hypothetical protein
MLVFLVGCRMYYNMYVQVVQRFASIFMPSESSESSRVESSHSRVELIQSSRRPIVIRLCVSGTTPGSFSRVVQGNTTKNYKPPTADTTAATITPYQWAHQSRFGNRIIRLQVKRLRLSGYTRITCTRNRNR